MGRRSEVRKERGGKHLTAFEALDDRKRRGRDLGGVEAAELTTGEV
jgi:hypothetical protein